MKQDQDLLYWILAQAERFANGYPLILTNGAQYGGQHHRIDSTQGNFLRIYEHIMLLKDYGLAEVRNLGQTFDSPTGVAIDRITAKGYKFLENTDIDLTIKNGLQNDQQILAKSRMKEDKIFIGHGRSKVWLELNNFLSQRLHLKCDEFNREPTAGQTTQQRLQNMLDDAVFAFLIMTAEDLDQDGNHHARANVIHEAGLFQGRLGFQKAIILLEEGCTEFSNIQGLTQIRFPKNDILARSENIRAVLEREGILKKA